MIKYPLIFGVGMVGIFFNVSIFAIIRLYKEEKIDGTNSGVKWTCPNIHDLVTILDKLQIELILDNVFDKRLSKLEAISVVQLREECQQRNLNKSGSKVLIYTCPALHYALILMTWYHFFSSLIFR